MENASKALIMAAGVLIGVLIISLAVYLFATFGATSAQIHSQNAEKQVTQFNTKFTSYEDKEGLTIYDIITVAGFAKENNDYYGNDENYTIEIIKQGQRNFQNNLDNKNSIITKETGTDGSLPTYKCKVTDYHENGRVKTVVFTRN